MTFKSIKPLIANRQRALQTRGDERYNYPQPQLPFPP
jgi:hypothetical protein